MSFYRFGLAASITLLVAVMSSAAFAGCCGGCGGCGGGYAVVYAQPPVYAAPIVYAQPVPVAPLAYAPPPQPIMPAPIAVDHWDTHGFDLFGGPGYGFGGCGCGCGCAHRGFFGGGGYAFGGAPAPLYFVNQGPQYSGPGLMLPYPTYAPSAGIAAPWAYPYISRYRYGRYRHYYHAHHWRG